MEDVGAGLRTPTETHQAHPIFEHTAENVAFRRARGKFILKTNIDNILSPDTVAWQYDVCFASWGGINATVPTRVFAGGERRQPFLPCLRLLIPLKIYEGKMRKKT